jgi:hypothetical protein
MNHEIPRVPREAEIWVGDLARALTLLEPMDDEAFRAIARTLGFDIAVATPTTQQPTAPESQKPVTTTTRPVRVTRTPETPVVQTPSDAEAIPLVLESPRTQTVAPPQVSDAHPRVIAQESLAPLPHEPLFFPRWTRAILSNALATTSPDGPIDVARVIEHVTRREPLRALPRLPEPTLRRGVQLLMDQGEAMNPYKRDQQELFKRMTQVVGRDKVQALTFRGFPLPQMDGAAQNGWGTFPITLDSSVGDLLFDANGMRRGEYYPPPSGTVVALFTDLGIGQPVLSYENASPQLWNDFARQVHRAGCPLVVFVPYALSRIPLELTGLFRVVPWDRKTTANQIRRIIGRAHRIDQT